MNTTIGNSTNTSSITDNTSNPNTSQETRSEWLKTVSVNVNTENTSVMIFLLCFFLPFLAPIIALIRGKFLFVLAIIALWIVGLLFIWIPIIWWIIALIIDIFIAFKVAKMKKNTQVVVNV